MTLHIEKPGLLSVFQDLGRWGYQHLGVSVSGAMDVQAHRLANLIVGNDQYDHATLEMTLMGPSIRFERSCCICLTGADMQADCDGEPVTPYRPIVIRSGQTLRLRTAVKGARAYLAVHGGFDLPQIMGSQSTSLRATLGGWQGRAIRKGDRIALRQALPDNDRQLAAIEEALWQQHIYLPAPLAIFSNQRARLRIIRSHQWPLFTRQSQEALIRASWRISPDSERMGYRLEGPTLQMLSPVQMLSEATVFGTIQVPGAGQPIVLMADRQTTGGYPKIATIANVDLPALAQKRPGEHIQFALVRHTRAQLLDQRREQSFEQLAITSVRIRQIIAQRH